MRLTKQEWLQCHEYALQSDKDKVPYQAAFDTKAAEIENAKPLNRALRREFADDRYWASVDGDIDSPPW